MKLELDRDPPPAPEPQAVCGFTADDYTQVLADLLPRGWAWPRDLDSILMTTMSGLAVEFARVHARDCDLLTESYPGTALETLIDWERICGLPDDCTPPGVTIQERRDMVLAKLAARGGQSRAYYIAVAEALGYDGATIDEFKPFRASLSRAGDPCFDQDWIFIWRMNVPQEGGRVIWFRAGQSAAGEPLRRWESTVLECVINKLKPAHTRVFFSYAGVTPPPLGSIWDQGQSPWDNDQSRWDQPPP